MLLKTSLAVLGQRIQSQEVDCFPASTIVYDLWAAYQGHLLLLHLTYFLLYFFHFWLDAERLYYVAVADGTEDEQGASTRHSGSPAFTSACYFHLRLANILVTFVYI